MVAAYLSRKHCCWGRGVGRAKAAEDWRALPMLPSRLLLFQELGGLCRLGDLPGQQKLTTSPSCLNQYLACSLQSAAQIVLIRPRLAG